jgi:hypothetical protein
MGIELINEVAKLKVDSAGSSGGTGSAFGGTSVIFRDKKHFSLTNLSSSNPWNAGSSSYQRGFNHGAGQFSVAAIPFFASNATQTQFYVQPFTVNQTTGLITTGTGSTVWTNGSGNCQSTMNWGSSGQYAWNWGQHCGPGYSTNTGIATVWGCSGNSVSGTYYTDGNSSWPANANQDAATSISGGVHYWAPSNNLSGDPRNLVFSYNGSSLTRTRNNSLSSYDTSTNYVWPVVPQFGNQASTIGTIHLYRRSNARSTFNILGPTFDIQSTVNTGSIGENVNTTNIPSNDGLGIELSNGKQIFYSNQYGIILRDGTSLTDISSSADMIPNKGARSRHFTPVAQDTWICLSEGNPREMVKFSINPTTYRVTILGSFSAHALSNNTYSDYTGNGGAFITGSNNQFVVLVTHRNNSPSAIIWVGEHTL